MFVAILQCRRRALAPRANKGLPTKRGAWSYQLHPPPHRPIADPLRTHHSTENSSGSGRGRYEVWSSRLLMHLTARLWHSGLPLALFTVGRGVTVRQKLSCGPWPPVLRPQTQLAIRARSCRPGDWCVGRSGALGGGSIGCSLKPQYWGGLQPPLHTQKSENTIFFLLTVNSDLPPLALFGRVGVRLT